MRQFGLNPFSVVLLPRFDLSNGRETVFCDWRSNELCKVSGVGYDLLESIDLDASLNINSISHEMNQYLNYFIDKGVIETYE